MVNQRTVVTRSAILIALLSYLVSSFAVFGAHLSEIASAEDNCPACREANNFAAGTINVYERCEPGNPCHNPNHSHHNHPLHDDNCSLCLIIHQHFSGALTQSANNYYIELTSDNLCLFIRETIYNNAIPENIEIRGPPIHTS
jgi:hypothetical protein